MAMPSTSLTWSDKILIQIISVLMFMVSNVWYGHRRIRSIGISNFPLSFALFCKYSKPFARIQSLDKRKKYDLKTDDDVDDLIFVRTCLLWSIMQFICVISGLFDWYCDVIIKGSIIFHIMLTVSDSIRQRPILQMEEELKKRRKQKLQLESAYFWKFLLPKPIFILFGYQKVMNDHATNSKPLPLPMPMKSTVTDDDDTVHLNKLNEKQKEELQKKLKIAKNVVKGKRETATEDLIWGVIQIAYVGFDVTHKQAIGTAFICYLCTLLEDYALIILSSNSDSDSNSNDNKTKKKNKKINWFKLVWILICVYITGKLFFS
jgi:DNA uptake protein ComE-like DNA-binding protein